MTGSLLFIHRWVHWLLDLSFIFALDLANNWLTDFSCLIACLLYMFRLSSNWMFRTGLFTSHSRLAARYIGLFFATGAHLYICLLSRWDNTFGGSFGGDVAVDSLILLHRQWCLWHWLSHRSLFHLKTCSAVTSWGGLIENVHWQSAMDGHRLIGWLTGAQTAEYHCTRGFIHALHLGVLVGEVLEACI